MNSFIKLYTNKKGEIKKFLNDFLHGYHDNFSLVKANTLEYQINYDNPIYMSDIIGIFIDNKDSYEINMWVSIDQDVLINITNHNADNIIKYLYERFPY